MRPTRDVAAGLLLPSCPAPADAAVALLAERFEAALQGLKSLSVSCRGRLGVSTQPYGAA